jgi:hypothetical protein
MLGELDDASLAAWLASAELDALTAHTLTRYRIENSLAGIAAHMHEAIADIEADPRQSTA